MKTRPALVTAAATLALPLLFNLASAAPAKPAAKKVVGPPDVAWKDMTAQQRAAYMKAVVTPKMKAAFQAYDADLFTDFGCETCHGKQAKKKKFKMPNPDIASLPGTPEAFQAALKQKASWPRWTKFMGEQVKPQMASLLGVTEFDPKKPEAGGFSCNGCHVIDKK